MFVVTISLLQFQTFSVKFKLEVAAWTLTIRTFDQLYPSLDLSSDCKLRGQDLLLKSKSKASV